MGILQRNVKAKQGHSNKAGGPAKVQQSATQLALLL
jgi:hypothetical protein